MSILLGILGAEIFFGVAGMFIFFLCIAFLPDIIIGALVFLAYALLVAIGITGLCIVCSAYSGGGRFGGVLVMVLGFGGLIALINIGDIEDYAREQNAKQQTAILDNAKTFLSVENLCDSESIESVEILFTPKLVDASASRSYRGYNTDVYIDNVNSQRIQNANWEQAWPSKSSMVPFEITGIPVSKNDTNFAIRLTTKDKKSINNIYFVYHKVYIEPKDINPNGAALIEFAYNGTKLIIKNGDIIKNDESFFSENTIVFMEHDAMHIDINDHYIYPPSIKWDMHEYSNCRKDYLDSYYNHLDTSGIPLNITMKYLEPGADFTVSYTDFSTTPWERIEQKYIAGEKNLISVGKNSVSVSRKPCFTKFDYTKAFFN